jgi:electron transport complex protein RnfC
MKTIIDRIEHGNFWKFHGGIHPPEQKFLTCDKPIRILELPKQLVLPLQQHIGQEGRLLVQSGDSVLKGQQLTAPTSPMAVPIHAPTSGKIADIKIATIAHPSGMSGLCIFISPDGKDTWKPRTICEQYQKLTNEEIIAKITSAGIAGMGGAGFPTHLKVNINQYTEFEQNAEVDPKTKNGIDYLIINAAECEPYITADDLLIREQSPTIIDGIHILDKLLSPALILIGIEDNKPQAINALKKATEHLTKIKVCVLPTKYPSGGEKQLIKLLTGKEITSGTLPIHSGIVSQNIATCYAIADAVINDSPLIHRVVTVTGQSLSKPQNIWVPFGTPVGYLLDQCGYSSVKKTQRIIMGGPMMGFSLPNANVPIVKTTSCIIAPTEVEIPTAADELDCIRCGKCAEVCPSQLLPQELLWSAKAKDHTQLTKLNLSDCIDCGACAYVCPSNIPLVQYYRVAKAEIKQQQQLDHQAEKAKLRFEARKQRLAQEKIDREVKQKKAADARRATMAKKTASGENPQSAVAAALARVKAKKAANAAGISDNKSEISPAQKEINSDTQAEAMDDKKAQVKDAIARAKAKAQKKMKDKNSLPAEEKPVSSVAEDKSVSSSCNAAVIDKSAVHSSIIQQEDTDKKSKIAAAIAKAKVKKLAAEEVHQETPEQQGEKAQKKARIAAAIAKAKAKKMAAKNDKPAED